MDTENYSVKELNTCDSTQINGGIGPFTLMIGMLCLHYAVQFAGNPQAHIDAFKEGMEMAKQ